MGYFLAVSAIRNSSVADVTNAIVEFTSRHDVRSSILESTQVEYTPSSDTLIFDPANEWTVVLWPEYFNIHDFAASLEMSRRLQTIMCSAHSYDGDYWAHGLFERGAWPDKFCSIPDYFAENDADAERLAAEWRGDPAAFASRFQVSEAMIAPYFAQFRARPLDSNIQPPQFDLPTGKIAPDDDFEIENIWVFTDFWRKLGIEYPQDVSKSSSCIRLGRNFMRRLPNLGEL
jgi:hypothetical protein